MSELETKVITAFEIHEPAGMEISAARPDRLWMDQSVQRFAYRCLPLVVANQHGWMIANPTRFRVMWSNGMSKECLKIEFAGRQENRIVSHFGEAVLTFSLPYIFRTPPGINLWVKGPTNHIKDGIQPLEGIVETDWLPSTFTMNWRLTRLNHWVEFQVGEPICMIVPIPRGMIEGFTPRVMPLAADTELKQQYDDWNRKRSEFIAKLNAKEPEAVKRGWQKEYFQGKDQTGAKFDDHQTKLQVREFKRMESPSPNAEPFKK